MNKSFLKNLEDYIDLRRGLGFQVRKDKNLLYRFHDFLIQEKASYIKTILALEFACRNPNASRAQWASRLTIIRRFAKYMKTLDQRTEIPAPYLMPYRFKRMPPFIYSDKNIIDILQTCIALEYKHELDHLTYYTLFGLIAVTGMRLSEVRGLKNESVNLDKGILTVRESKFNKSRYLPLHSTTTDALREYQKHKAQLQLDSSIFFFVDESGNQLKEHRIRKVFHQILIKIDLWKIPLQSRPKIMSFRHSFAVKVLTEWYKKGLNIDVHIPLLSTYLGHVRPSLTYWYLTGTKELLQLALLCLERSKGGGK
jgi:integrase/recombinase XerD